MRARVKEVGRRLARKALGRAGEGSTGEPALVRFEGHTEGLIEPETTLLQAADQLGVDLNHYCGGYCSCATCRVEILEGAGSLSAMRGNEQMVLGANHVARGDRLACQARVKGPVTVRIPEWF